MPLEDLTEAAVLAAVAEFDAHGRDRFLERSGSGPARSYFVELDGRLYDSGAIAAHAHRIDRTGPRRTVEPEASEKAVAERLRRLGFTVRLHRNPAWSRDEIVLVCGLVEANGWRAVPQESPEVVELSALLQSTAIHPLDGRAAGFRSPAGVAGRTRDLVSCLPGHPRSAGNRLDVEVVEAFRSRPGRMREEVAAIRTALREWGDGIHALRDLDMLEGGAGVGSALLRRHLRRERKAALRSRKIAQARELGRPVACEVCDVDFSVVYGEHGTGYIECHHRPSLHGIGPTQTHIDDLALICSNCHRMIHRTTPALTVEELSAIVRSRRGQGSRATGSS
ncbi:HNH endonuclease [Pseudonocardia parietis]|uniref:5-methylcytosine-specific restriction protein A n=1 Tax=Pseudonocardia parietis TaxID=570936 RepID=A0ABS4VVX2_9PSEU|nr:HNH endonuclease [Pseudonocardia parietis]MBP2367674.1 5-methylcytosine-specific restriction protein A [Pseudonocardia parietis]